MTTHRQPALPPRAARGRLLIATDRPHPGHGDMRDALLGAGHAAATVSSGECLVRVLAEPPYDIIIADLPLLQDEALGLAARLGHRTAILALLQYAVTESAVKAMKLGAQGVLLLSADRDKVLEEVDRLVALNRAPGADDPMVRYIIANIAVVHSRAHVAARFGLSPHTVSMRVKDRTRQSFPRFLESCRIDEAKRLLRYTRLSAKQIAARVGFNSAQRFCHSFGKVAGCTSKHYRRSCGTGP